MSVLEYKCPHCGGSVEFDSASQQMKCPYCGSEFELEALKGYQAELQDETPDKFDWETYQGAQLTGEELGALSAYRCPSCGGEILGDATTAATHCPYCGNPAVMPQQLSGVFKPDFVLPFKLDKAAAKINLAKHLRGKPLLPKLFKAENRIDSITGMYVPFWLFGCDAHGRARYRATRVTAWSDSRYNYTKTDTYSVIREGDSSFARVPADGSQKMDDAQMDSIEPFDYADLKPFETAYLSGYLADKYDVDAEGAKPRANERIKTSAEGLLRETVTGYATVVPENVSIQLSGGTVEYALMPVWSLVTKYKDKLYSFVMNGQTGKFVGDLPTDWGLFWRWFFGLFAGCTALGVLLLWIIDLVRG